MKTFDQLNYKLFETQIYYALIVCADASDERMSTRFNDERFNNQ